jgi:hypothetical protein
MIPKGITARGANLYLQEPSVNKGPKLQPLTMSNAQILDLFNSACKTRSRFSRIFMKKDDPTCTATVDQLINMWNAAGKPTKLGDIRILLRNAGFTSEALSELFRKYLPIWNLEYQD